MRASLTVVATRELLAAAGGQQETLGRLAVRVAERIDGPAELLLIAVPAGQGEDLANRIVAKRKRRDRPPLYLSEIDEHRRAKAAVDRLIARRSA
jgi:hypothetical protein